MKEMQEKEMTAHSSILAWRIPRTEEPGELQSLGSQRVGHKLATKESSHFGVILLMECCATVKREWASLMTWKVKGKNITHTYGKLPLLVTDMSKRPNSDE